MKHLASRVQIFQTLSRNLSIVDHPVMEEVTDPQEESIPLQTLNRGNNETKNPFSDNLHQELVSRRSEPPVKPSISNFMNI